MRGNKEAIKQVLKFHRKVTEPTTKKPVEVKKATEDPYEGLNIKFKEWKPDTVLSETTTPKVESTTTTEEKTTRTKGRSSINLFQKFQRKTTTMKSTTVSELPTTSSSFRFGERTSKKNLEIEAKAKKNIYQPQIQHQKEMTTFWKKQLK